MSEQYNLGTPRDFSSPQSMVSWVVQAPSGVIQVGETTLQNLLRTAKTRAYPENMAAGSDFCPGNMCREWVNWMNVTAGMTDPKTEFWEYIPPNELPQVSREAWTPELLKTLIYVAFEKPRKMSFSKIAVPRNVTFPAWAARTPNPTTPLVSPAYRTVESVVLPAGTPTKSGPSSADILLHGGQGTIDNPRPAGMSSMQKLLLAGGAGLAAWYFFFRETPDAKSKRSE